MSSAEQKGVIGIDNQDCVGFTINSGTSNALTCHFKDSGTNTATARYFSLQNKAHRVAILTTQDCSITHVNGKELTTPLPISNTGWNQFTKGIRWENITVRADVNSTAVIVFAY